MNASSDSVFGLLRLFLRDFASFAGTKGLLAFFFVFLGAFVEGVSIVLLIPFLSVIIDAQNASGWVQGAASWLFAVFSTESRFAKLALLVIVFAVLMVARAGILTMRDVMMAQLELGFIQHIRSRITHRLAAARWDTVSNLRHSRITHLMGAGIQQIDNATYMFLHAVVAVVVLASQFILAFLVAPALAAVAFGVVLLGIVTLLPMIRRARAIGSFVTEANLSLIDDTTQFLGALKLAISQNLQDNFTREFEATLSELKAQQIRYVRQQTITRLAVITLSGVVAAIFVLLGFVFFEISASVLITLLLILSRMSAPAMTLQLDTQQIAHALPAYEKIDELERDLVAAEAPVEASSGSATHIASGPIVFRGVSFLHGTADNTSGGIRNLNVTIEPGSIVGIKGPSGAGKTTFADLLVGLYPPQAGEILVGSAALRGALVTAWRNSVGYVAQDPFLFHDTIRRNLLWAHPEAGEGALWDALRLAGAEDIVRNAEQGLDSTVGERGGLLSGGERQRLCLARAMLRRPQLLVLDEATSSIDIDSEHALLERLMQVTPRPTIVMIAHRLESLRHCQRVLHFEVGVIVADDRGPAHAEHAGLSVPHRRPG